MKLNTALVSGVLVCSAIFLYAQAPSKPDRAVLLNQMASPKNPATPAKVDLGRMLYYEPRLSKNNDVSCNSCHDLASYGVDGQPTSTGHMSQKGGRNAPTVYHAAGHLAQFWDGRAADVEAQAKGPVLNPIEMAMPSAEEVEVRLRAIPGYVTAFKKAFPGEQQPVTFENMATAIGAFERNLVTPSRWDRYLAGDKNAVTEEELRGYQEFVKNGCQACHSGTYIGGGLYHRLGARKAWPVTSDAGRIEVTKVETDRMVFKVPSLRNIEKTGPYFHDGKVNSLAQAVRLMGEYQVGEDLTDERVNSIVAWLQTLTGEIPQEYIRKPQLPQ